MLYFYIHGFNSGPESRSGAELEKIIGKPVVRIKNDYSKPFNACARSVMEQINAASHNDEPLCVMGTSLGGFYALSLRVPNLKKVVAFNPVIFPALQLAQFLGENTRFTDGETWNFGNEARLSYAAAADPRQWRNFDWDSLEPCPQRHIFLGDHDESLDHEVSLHYWRNHASVSIINSGHSVADFSPARVCLP